MLWLKSRPKLVQAILSNLNTSWTNWSLKHSSAWTFWDNIFKMLQLTKAFLSSLMITRRLTTTAQLHLTKPILHKFKSYSQHVARTCNSENFWQWTRLEISLAPLVGQLLQKNNLSSHRHQKQLFADVLQIGILKTFAKFTG